MAQRKIIAQFIVDSATTGKTIAAIMKEDLHISSRQRQKIVRTKGIKLDGRVVHSETKVREGQLLEISLPYAEQIKVQAQPLNLDVVYEDADILVVNKPAGIIVHPLQQGSANPSLVEGVAYHYQKQGLSITPRPVHRLDQWASGLVIFAKSAEMQHKLSQSWSKFVKIYWVKVYGRIDQGGEITTPIDGKPACTRYTPVVVGDQFTTLKVQIFTGRTHQIRKHLAELGHPVVGDHKYGIQSDCQATGCTGFPDYVSDDKRLLLHCWRIQFEHPRTRERITLEAPLPF